MWLPRMPHRDPPSLRAQVGGFLRFPGRRTILAYVSYMAVALLSQASALPALTSRSQLDGDVPQTDWFLGWTQHALLT